MNFTNPIPRAGLPVNREGSFLHSVRESGSAAKQWQRTEPLRRQIDSLTNSIGQMRRTIGTMRRGGNSFASLHPFKLYQFPTWMRNYHPSDEWRRCKVRFGYLITPEYQPPLGGAWGGGYNTVRGCDNGSDFPNYGPEEEVFLTGSEIPPNDSTAASTSWHEIVVPDDGNTYYVWLSVCADAMLGTPGFDFVICYGTSAVNCTELYTGTTVTDPWPAFTGVSATPTSDPYHFLIGSLKANNTTASLTINQFIYDNLFFGGTALQQALSYSGGLSMRFRGEFDAAQYYYAGDIVMKTSTDFIQEYILFPKDPHDGGTYYFGKGPVVGVDPATNSPEPWLLKSNSPRDINMSWSGATPPLLQKT